MSDIRFNQWLHQSGTGGVSQVASGAVGVGTTNPLADFYVRGDAQITGILTAGHIAMGSSITFGDDDRAYFGDGTDLQIYHSGSHSFIQDTGTGNLFIDSNSVQIRNAVASKTTAKFFENAQVELYYNNTERIRTTNTGALVTGILTATSFSVGNLESTGNLDLTDSGRLMLGTGDDLQIYHSGSGNFVDVHTNNLQFRTSGTTELMAEFKLNNAVDLYYDGTKRFETKTNGAQVNGTTLFIRGGSGEDSILQFIANNSASYNDHYNFRVAATGAFALQTEVSANNYENLLTATQNGAVELYNNNSRKLRTYSDGVKIASDANTGRLVLEDTSGNYCYQLTGYNVTSAGAGGRATFQDSTGAVVLDMRASGGNIFSYNTLKMNGNSTVDNLKLVFGAGSDFELYHDGTSNIILANSGDLNIRMNSSENAIVSRQNGAVELYHNNVKKCETTTTGLSITGTVSPTTPLSHRNFLINGSTTIWQRGTDSNLHTSSGTYTCDRWWRANGATRVVRSTAVPAGFPYSLEVYSNGGTTSIGQAIELSGTGRSQFKHSTQYTLSFYARTVTGTNDISANVYYRNDKFSTTNQTNWSGSAGNNSLWLMGTMTTSWQRFYKTFTSPGNPHANNKVLAIEFNNTSAYYITGIQFEEGAVTPFEFRNYQEELANCQRYYENVTGPSLQTTSHSETLIGVAQAYTSSRALMNYKFSVQKRQHPALECSSASNVQILVPSTGWISAGNVYGYTNQMASRVDLRNISGSPLTVGHACEVRVINDGVIGFNAEL